VLLEKIISGGQTGADRAGLIAGKLLGLKTGGTAPPGFLTERGPEPKLQNFGLVEGQPDSRKYVKRTIQNILDSDGTLIMGITTSPGSTLTLTICREYSKPCIINPTSIALKEWLDLNHIKTLNVAGNRESKNPGIRDTTLKLLVSALGEK